MKTMRTLLVCVLLRAALVPGQIQPAQTYRDIRTGLVIHFPEGWKIENEPSTSAFTILSFDPKKRPPQMLVPLDGAQIVLAGPPTGVASIADWLNSDRIQATRGYHLTSTEVQTEHLGPLTSTMARRQIDVIPEGTIVIYFFEIENRPLKVALIYRGQKRAEYFENVLLAVIKTLELVTNRGQPADLHP